MKVLVILSLLLLTVAAQGPLEQPAQSDLVVTKFSWTKYRQGNGLIHGVENPPSMNEPISIQRPPPRNEPSEVRNRRDMTERRVDMAISEANARLSANKSPDFYVLRLQLKNAGTNVIKSFVWEFQPAAATADYEPRQYVCTVKAKPNESKTFEILTPFAPVKVVSSEKKSNEKDGNVVINQIEYSDRAPWKRKGWTILVPPETTQKLSVGKCLVF
jgi:hypothetical protein